MARAKSAGKAGKPAPRARQEKDLDDDNCGGLCFFLWIPDGNNPNGGTWSPGLNSCGGSVNCGCPDPNTLDPPDSPTEIAISVTACTTQVGSRGRRRKGTKIAVYHY
jgi:hypothetical protein